MTGTTPCPPQTQDTIIAFRPSALIDLKKLEKFPPAARQREIIKIVDKYIGNGVHLFVHYTTPILELRRKQRLASGQTKKKYHKSPSQLWGLLSDEQKLFWDHQAKVLRLEIAKGKMSHEKCVEDAGLEDAWQECLKFSESAVAEYLEVPLPDEYLMKEEVAKKEGADGVEIEQQQVMSINSPPVLKEEKEHVLDATQRFEKLGFEAGGICFKQPAAADDGLLDTIREPFAVEPRMIYGNFAQLYPYTIVRKTEGRRQIAFLRQLADLLDPSGKELFYYYATPRLWKTIRPTDLDETIASVVHKIWTLMEGPLKKEWEMANASVKKLLGDGNIDGLDGLELEKNDELVWKLHDLTEKAIREYNMRMAKSNGVG